MKKKPITPKEFYICDPDKNLTCPKTSCGYPCFCTTDKKYAKDPEHTLTRKEYNAAVDIRRKIYGYRAT